MPTVKSAGRNGRFPPCLFSRIGAKSFLTSAQPCFEPYPTRGRTPSCNKLSRGAAHRRCVAPATPRRTFPASGGDFICPSKYKNVATPRRWRKIPNSPRWVSLAKKSLNEGDFPLFTQRRCPIGERRQVVRSGPAGREYPPASSCRRNEMIFRARSSMTDFPGADRRALPCRPIVAQSMIKPVRIALDAMGGDHGPEVIVPGAARALQRRPDMKFLFFGDAARIRPTLDAEPGLSGVSTLRHTGVSVRMDAKPSQALRAGRRTSSMWLAIEAVKKNEADVAVSAGNTGALMAMAKICLHM